MISVDFCLRNLIWAFSVLVVWGISSIRHEKLEPIPESYAGDIANGLFDFNQINPFLDNPELVIQRLILPPA